MICPWPNRKSVAEQTLPAPKVFQDGKIKSYPLAQTSPDLTRPVFTPRIRNVIPLLEENPPFPNRFTLSTTRNASFLCKLLDDWAEHNRCSLSFKQRWDKGSTVWIQIKRNPHDNREVVKAGGGGDYFHMIQQQNATARL